MADARRRDEWDRAALMVATIANASMKATQTMTVDEIHPYLIQDRRNDPEYGDFSPIKAALQEKDATWTQ